MELSTNTAINRAAAPKGTLIRVKIANGHKPQVDAIIESNPGMLPATAAQQWVAQRFGNWITGNITDAFSFKNVCPASFDVLFSSAEHAREFQSLIGGQEVADAS